MGVDLNCFFQDEVFVRSAGGKMGKTKVKWIMQNGSSMIIHHLVNNITYFKLACQH